MKQLPLPALALAFLSTPLLAGGMDLGHVAADARWVVHVDLQGIQRTTFWRHLHESGVFDREDFEDLNEIEREFGINPLRDVHSLTVYGTGTDHEDAVAVVSASASVDAALRRLSAEESYRTVSSGDLQVHAWEDGGESYFAYIHESAPDRRLVVLADESELLLDGIRVVLGQSESLANASSPLIAARPSAGSLLFVAATQGLPAMDWNHTTSQVFGLAERLSVDIGEDQGTLFARAALVTADPEDAANLYDIVQGFLALGRMAISHADELPPEVLDFMDSLKVQRRDRQVVVDFTYNSLRLIEALEELEDF